MQHSPTPSTVLLAGTVMMTALLGLERSDTIAEEPVRTNLIDQTQQSLAWPRFLGSTFDGSSTANFADIDWSREPELAWSINVGDGYGFGSIANGKYLQCDADPDQKGEQIEERLRCFDLKTGIQQWTSSQPILYSDMLGYEDGPRSSPTIVGDLVYTFGVTGWLTCRSMVDGAIVWTIDTNTDYGVVQNFFGVGSSPLVLDDKLIVMVGGSPKEDQNLPPMRLDRLRSNGSAVVAFHRKTGKELWRCGDDLASYSNPRPVNVNGETLVLLFARTGLLAIDPQKGKVRWKYDHRAEVLESVNAMVPIVEDNHVLISECYEVGSVLLKISASSDPEIVWKDPNRNRRSQAMRSHWATPVLVDGFLYGCSGRNAPDSDFRCVNFMTGKVQWSDSRRIRSSVTRVGQFLVVLEERGVLQILTANPEELDKVAQWDLGVANKKRPAIEYPCWSAPIVVGDLLIVRGTNQVVALQLARKP